MSSVRFSLKFHSVKDADVIDWLRQQDNVNDYIRNLVACDRIINTVFCSDEPEVAPLPDDSGDMAPAEEVFGYDE